MLDAYASLSHYASHLAPIWDALPGHMRGKFLAPRSGRPWGEPIASYRGTGPVMVAGFADAKRMHGRPLVYVEHGSGQSYRGDERSATHGSYSGGAGLDDVVLFICPSETVAQRWRDAYPDTPAVAVGCPRLDQHHARVLAQQTPLPAVGHGRGATPGEAHRPTVAVAWHWDLALVPETRSALPHYRAVLGPLRDALCDAGALMVGHGHPRAWSHLRRLWDGLGVRAEPNVDEVLAHADVLVVDNSSIGPEFASLGKPVIWLSAPWYRREVEHSWRFWDWTTDQPHVEQPQELVPAVFAALGDPHAMASGRDRMVRAVYSACDGNAAARAAAAIVEVLDYA